MSKCEHDFSLMVDGDWVCIICGKPKSEEDKDENGVKVFSAIFNLNVEYKIKAKTAEEAEEKAQEMMINAELPENYVSDSVEFVKVVEE